MSSARTIIINNSEQKKMRRGRIAHKALKIVKKTFSDRKINTAIPTSKLTLRWSGSQHPQVVIGNKCYHALFEADFQLDFF